MELRVLHRVIYGSTTPHKSQLEALRINSAILQRYSRHRVVGCDYPAIVASSEPSACVRGTYVEGLTAADIWRLDIFEGDEYERVKVSPRLLTADGQVGEEIIGETYVWIKPVDMLEEREWDFDEFRREKLRHWVGGSAEYEGEPVRPSIAGASSEGNERVDFLASADGSCRS